MLWNVVASKPVSNSPEYSGLRFALPSELERDARLIDAVDRRASCDVKKRVAAVVPGCTPDAPYVARRRKELSQSVFGKKLSSETRHDSTDLRVVDALERPTERAVAVVAQTAGEEERDPAHDEHFLGVGAEA